MTLGFAALPPDERYALTHARVPAALATAPGAVMVDDLARVDVLIDGATVADVRPAGTGLAAWGAVPAIDLRQAIVFPGFVDAHTHLDKGHIWPRKSNPDGSFPGALNAVGEDRAANWSATDVERRVEFGLRAAYAHGTVAIRTHLDSVGGQENISPDVFMTLRARWAGRIELQAVTLCGIDHQIDRAHAEKLGRINQRVGGTYGSVTYLTPNLEAGLVNVFDMAERFGLDLDFHVDETQDPMAASLGRIAEIALERRYQGKIQVGHCCSITRQPAEQQDRVMDLVAKAGIAVVSLPMCNMYLQERHAGRTPRYRGVTLLHEMKARGINVSVASDNTRDPFYAYGDLDMLEVYREATRIAHFDHPVADWPATVTALPAKAMGLTGRGIVAPGAPADLVLFKGRSWTELLSRPWTDRTVIRAGRAIERLLPDYSELDDIVGAP
jgi:cytosine/creatinine deaminase